MKETNNQNTLLPRHRFAYQYAATHPAAKVAADVYSKKPIDATAKPSPMPSRFDESRLLTDKDQLLRQKDAQILQLLEERARLEMALHTIKSMTDLISGSPQSPNLTRMHARSAQIIPSPDLTATIGQAQSSLAPAFSSPLQTPGAESQASVHLQTHEQGSVESRHVVFDAEMRSKITDLYDLVDPFRPNSQASKYTDKTPVDDEKDLLMLNSAVRQRQLWPLDGGNENEDPQRQSVPILRDYSAPFRPDVIDEASMNRILDGPYSVEALTNPRAGAVSCGANHSAPASIARSEDEKEEGGGLWGSWALGSLSLPGSARGHVSDSEEIVRPTAAIEQLHEGSDAEAGAVLQLLSDGLAMRVSAHMHSETHRNKVERAHPLRHSAPAVAMVVHVPRGSFLQRQPLSADIVYGIDHIFT